MKKSRDFILSVVNAFELPPEAVLGVPLITLTGRENIKIENYISLTEYTPDNIRIHTKEGSVKISGSQIKIKEITEDEIALVGSFTGIEYEL